MAYRPALFIALLLALLCLLLPSSRHEPRTSLPITPSALMRLKPSVAIYRFWSSAVPFCELYFQFTSQREPRNPAKLVSGCGQQLAKLHGCQRHDSVLSRSHFPDAWNRMDDKIDSTAKASGHQSCRYKENSFVL